MARPNPDWPGNAALGSAPPAPAPEPTPAAFDVVGEAPAPGRVVLDPMQAQIVVSLLMTDTVPVECVPEGAQVIHDVVAAGDAPVECVLSHRLTNWLADILTETAVPKPAGPGARSLLKALEARLDG